MRPRPGGGPPSTWGQNAYRMWQASMGLVGPPQLAGYTKGQLLAIASQGAIAFGPEAEVPSPAVSTKAAPGAKPAGRTHGSLRAALAAKPS